MTDTGIFATAPRDHSGGMKYAYSLLLEGKPYSFAANVAGVSAADLRTRWPGMGRRDTAPVPVAAPATRATPLRLFTPGGMAIAAEVAAAHGFEVAEVLSENLKRPLCFARHELCFRLREELGWSLTRVARFVGRDHCTVHKGIAAHRRRQIGPQAQAVAPEELAA